MLDVPQGRRGGRAGSGWLLAGWGMRVPPVAPRTSQVTMAGRAGRQSYGTGLGEHSQLSFQAGGGLLRDTPRLLPLQAEGGLCKFLLQPEPRAGESRAQPWQVVGRGPAAPSLLVGPVFHQADLTWELRRFGARPSEQLGALLRASPFSTRWCWIKSCPEGHGVQTSKKFLLHLSVTIGTGSRTVTISIFLTRELTVYSNVQICAAWHLRGPRDVIN